MVREKLAEALRTGDIPQNLALVADFQLYLFAKRILAMPPAEQKQAISRVTPCLRDRVRHHAKIILSYSKKTIDQ